MQQIFNSMLGFMKEKNQIIAQESSNLLNTAMDRAKQNASPAMIMEALEQFGKSKGWDIDKLNIPHWNEMKKKDPNQVIPYAISCVKELGLFSKLASLFGMPK